jgi:flagellum-specific ATP synthase
MIVNLAKYRRTLAAVNPIRITGKVSEIVGLMVEGRGPAASVGDVCGIYVNGDERPVSAEVVGFKKGNVLLMPLKHSGPSAWAAGSSPRIARQASGWQGALGNTDDCNPFDNKGPVAVEDDYPLYADPINPLERGRIRDPVDLGIRVLNALLACGRGQRMGIFAGSGVGKSVLMGMMAKNTDADVNVIGLIGERGREVREFLENNLGEEGLARPSSWLPPRTCIL